MSHAQKNLHLQQQILYRPQAPQIYTLLHKQQTGHSPKLIIRFSDGTFFLESKDRFQSKESSIR